MGDRRAKRATAPINYAAIEATNSSDDGSSEEEEKGKENGEADNGNEAGSFLACMACDAERPSRLPSLRQGASHVKGCICVILQVCNCAFTSVDVTST